MISFNAFSCKQTSSGISFAIVVHAWKNWTIFSKIIPYHLILVVSLVFRTYILKKLYVIVRMKCCHVNLVEVPIRQINVNHVIKKVIGFDKFMSHSNPEWFHRMHVIRIGVLRISGILKHIVANIITIVVTNNLLIQLS